MDIYSIYRSKNIVRKPKRYHRYTSILSRRHPRLSRLISLIGPLPQEVPIWRSLNDAVLYAVIGQMLSVVAARSIIQRLLQKFRRSEAIIEWACGNTHIKGPIFGVSQRKRRALAEWASYLKRSDMASKQWRYLSTDNYRKQILDIWGFGPWSADMIAIFHLGKMNVWPVSDAGITKACRIVFGTKDTEQVRQIVKGCETVAAIYMWELLNRKLVSEIVRQ